MAIQPRTVKTMRPKVLETPKEWYECLEAGTAAVRRPYELPQFRKLGWPSLSVCHIPSFEDCHGWSVFPRRGVCTLHMVTWKQPADAQRMQDFMTGRCTQTTPQPTLEDRSMEIAADWFERQLATLATIRIPLSVKQSMGCDGENFGVHMPHQFEVEWWCQGPPEWAELAKWTHECIDYFRQRTAA